MINSNTTLVYEHKRGKIQESSIKAMVTDPLFHSRIERNKKGKGSYRRHAKHRLANSKGESPFKSQIIRIFKWAFYLKRFQN